MCEISESWKQHIDEVVEYYNNESGDLVGYNCPKCQNRGFFAKKNENYDLYYVECSCMNKRKAIQAKQTSAVADLLAKYNFDNFTCKEEWQTDMLTKAKEFTEDNARVFFIGGQVGAGKTRLCISLLNALIDKGCYEFETALWSDITKTLKANNFNETRYNNIMCKLVNVPVLYIDDFFKITPTQKDIEIAFDIINSRYNRNKNITIISSELNGKQLNEIDEAICSRLYEYAKHKYFISLAYNAKRNQRYK